MAAYPPVDPTCVSFNRWFLVRHSHAFGFCSPQTALAELSALARKQPELRPVLSRLTSVRDGPVRLRPRLVGCQRLRVVATPSLLQLILRWRFLCFCLPQAITGTNIWSSSLIIDPSKEQGPALDNATAEWLVRLHALVGNYYYSTCVAWLPLLAWQWRPLSGD